MKERLWRVEMRGYTTRNKYYTSLVSSPSREEALLLAEIIWNSMNDTSDKYNLTWGLPTIKEFAFRNKEK